MKVVVQKYGGSSLATPELIRRIAQRVISTKKRGYEVVVVVSALGDTTDHLVELAGQLTKTPPRREMDMLLSVGERIAIALLAIAISEQGFPAISFTGSQVGIITNTDHTRARILEIKGHRIRKELQEGKIVVVAGFQGVSVEKEITTLGRGGSDTTAVALAASLNAERCEIMTDVDGIYTANPRRVDNARLISEINYDEMLDMAELGSQVLKSSAVEFSKRHNIKIYVGSSFSGKIGTIVTGCPLDQGRVTGIAVDEDVVLLILHSPKKGSNFSSVAKLAREGIVARFVAESDSRCTIILKSEDQTVARELIAETARITIDEEIGLVSVIGVGINFETDVMAKALRIFEEIQVRPVIFNFSETRLSFGVRKENLNEVASGIHNALIIESKHAAI